MGVSFPASSPFGRYPPLPSFCQVGKDFACQRVLCHGANRHFHNEIPAASSLPVLAGAVPSRLGPEKVSISKVKQAVFSLRGLYNDAAPFAAAAPIGSASRHILLAPETNAAIAAFSGHNRDCHFINEFHLFIKLSHPKGRPGGSLCYY
jgi:hypothetical protein